MDQGPLVMEEIEAGADLVREFDNHEPVKAAFWLKANDEQNRFLYIASDGISAANLDVAYGEILRVVAQQQSPYLDPFRVKLIGTNHPLAQAAMDVHQRFPGRMATRQGGGTFGGESVDDVYIYPLPLPAAMP